MDNLNISYLKLHFVAEILEDCVLPKSKASALRGGTGQRMIEQNCVLPVTELRDEHCSKCECIDECIVQRFLYTPMSIKPDFSVDRSSMGYMFECEDYREEFREGDSFQFSVTLFGKSRVYVNLLLQALWALGNSGLGREKGRFFLREISNSRKQPIMVNTEYGPQILKEHLQPENLADYVSYRKRQVLAEHRSGDSLTVKFQSDTAMMYQKKLIEEFSSEALFANLFRRIYQMNCFVGDFIDYKVWEAELRSRIPKTVYQESRRFSEKRFSTRKQNAMYMKGLSGKLVIEAPDEEILNYLLAGEILHVGKNTSFGFGRYRVL